MKATATLSALLIVVALVTIGSIMLHAASRAEPRSEWRSVGNGVSVGTFLEDGKRCIAATNGKGITMVCEPETRAAKLTMQDLQP